MQLSSPAAIRSRIAARWRETVWGTPPAGRSRAARALVSMLRAWAHALRSFDSDLVDLRASALTYRSLLALVPSLAVAFSLVQAFGGLAPGEQALQALLFENLAPGTAEAALRYVTSFVERVSAGAVAGTGVLVLVFTVISLLSAIEASMNALWRIERGRGFLDRFVVYWATVTVGPLLLAVSLSVTSAGQSHVLTQRVSALLPLLGGVLLQVVPWLFACASLTLLYVIVPNTHVRFLPALGGGLVAGTLWEIAKRIFTWGSSSLFRYDAVYGSFGALPAFIVWLQAGWIIVLLGSKMTYVLQHARALREEKLQIDVGPEGRELLALAFVTRIARAFSGGQPPPTLSDLLPGTRGAINAAQEVLARLEAAQLVRPVPAGVRDGAAPEDEAYVPGRDAGSITVRDVVCAFRQQGAELDELVTAEPAIRRARELLARRQAATSAIDALTVADLLREVDELPAPPRA